MKAVIFLLFAGLLAVQAANFRVVYVPQLIDLDQLDFIDEDNQLWGIGDVVSNVQNGINTAVKNTANVANQVGHNIATTTNQIGKNVVNTVNTVNQNVATAVHNTAVVANQVGHNIATTTNQIGQNIATTTNQIGHNVAVTVQHIGQDLERMRLAFIHGFTDAEKALIRNAKPTVELLIKIGGFADAEQAWKRVDWKTGRGLDIAIQLTARDTSKLYNRLNKLSGGKLNDLAVNVAEKIAMSAFPPAGILLQTGKVAFRVAGQLHDITTMVHNIEDDVHKGDWAGVAIEGFKLFSLIAQDLK